MALTLDTSSVRAVPATIERGGGTVEMRFAFVNSNQGTFTTKYTLDNPQYVFGNGSRTVNKGPRNAPGAPPFRDSLTLRALVPSPTSPILVIQLETRETQPGSNVGRGLATVAIRDLAMQALVANLGSLEVARRAGVSRSTINRFNRGETVSDRTLRAVDDVLFQAMNDGDIET